MDTREIMDAVYDELNEGAAGISLDNGIWLAQATHQNVTYLLGGFERKEDAVAARRNAEELLRRNPEAFLSRYVAKTPRSRKK